MNPDGIIDFYGDHFKKKAPRRSLQGADKPESSISDFDTPYQ